MRKLIIIFTILLCNSFHSFSQTNFKKGYIITLDNDTIYGLIDYRSDKRNFNLCEFKPSESSPTREYLPGQILAYRFNNSKFYSSKHLKDSLESKYVFMEYLINGITDIYYYNGNYYIEKEDKFLKLTNEDIEYINENGQVMIKKSNRFKGIISYLYSDCRELQTDISNSIYTHKSLINIAHKYHKYMCTSDEECIIYEKKSSTARIDIAPLIGGTIQEYKIESTTAYWEDMKLEQDYSFLVGAIIDFKPVILNDNFRIQFKINAFNKNLKGSYSDLGPATETIYLANYSTLYLNTGLGIKYTYPVKSELKPFIGAGAYLNSILNETNEFKETIIDLQTGFEITTTNNFRAFDRHLGLYIDLGIEYSLNSKSSIILNIGYSFSRYEKSLIYDLLFYDIHSYNAYLAYYFNLF